jgi:hypothetical protein
VNAYYEYVEEVSKHLHKEPSLRQGQAAFNVLQKMHPDLADKILRTPIDPFYNDDCLLAFYMFVCEQLETALEGSLER